MRLVTQMINMTTGNYLMSVKIQGNTTDKPNELYKEMYTHRSGIKDFQIDTYVLQYTKKTTDIT